MAKNGLFQGGGQNLFPALTNPQSVFKRGQGGILPARGSQLQSDMVAALTQQAMSSVGSSGSPLLALLTPMLTGAVQSRTNGLRQGELANGRNKTMDTLLGAMTPQQAQSGQPIAGKAPITMSGMSDVNDPRAALGEAMYSGTGPAPSANPEERELLAKTLMAEAGGEGLQGMLAAGSVIQNRVANGNYGKGLRGVIMKPGQFSAWNGVTGYAGGKGAIDMANITPNEEALQAADMLLSGRYEDQTGGATHYYNPSVVEPKWGQRAGGDWTQIGNHVFGSADAGRGPTRHAEMNTGNQRDLLGILMDPNQPKAIQQMAIQQLQSGNGQSMDNIKRQKAEIELQRLMQPPDRKTQKDRHGVLRYLDSGEPAFPDVEGDKTNDAGTMRQQNEATTLINKALSDFMSQGFSREESAAMVARDPLFAQQLRMLGIDPADFARQNVQKDAQDAAATQSGNQDQDSGAGSLFKYMMPSIGIDMQSGLHLGMGPQGPAAAVPTPPAGFSEDF